MAGPRIERLSCHPRLALAAGLDADRPAIHVWDLGGGERRALATIDADSPEYDEAFGWDRLFQTPSVAWHPHEPRLAVAGRVGLRTWTPADGVARLHGVGTTCSCVAFSPDGRTLWASPAVEGNEDGEPGSIAVDLESGSVRPGPWWDTGISPHPGGRMALTFSSDQAETMGLFVRVDDDGRPGVPRVLSRALFLDVDCYELPVFSPDGGYVAIRGDAYLNVVHVFEFPSLHLVLSAGLGEADEEYHAWPRHNVAFAPDAAASLLVGTPDGAVVELDVATRRAVEHPVLSGRRVNALAVSAAGEVLVAGDSGDLVVLRRPGPAVPPAGAAERVAAFLATTRELAADADLREVLELTDGVTAWTGDGRYATEREPTTWLALTDLVDRD